MSQDTDSSSPDFGPAGPPKHVAVIMDGNGRWAKQRGLPRVEGHRMGAKTVQMLVEEARRLGIRYLTLYAFSTENWSRPGEEVSSLMGLFERYLRSELNKLARNGIRLRAIGDRSRLPDKVLAALEDCEAQTANQDGMQLLLAVSYGGREEILAAARRLAVQAASGAIAPEQIDERELRAGLYAPDVPDPDLLIRTSGESRISNFLLWQLAYAEIVVTPVLWPDFSKHEFYNCLSEFLSRDRRFGLTSEQLAELKESVAI